MNKEKERLYQRRYYEKNKERWKEYQREYYEKNKEKCKQRRSRTKEENLEYMRAYRRTPIGRANMLLQRYKRRDKEKGRSECDFDAQLIVDNIFSKSCLYCGETDWRKLGCNRIDNSKPHTKDNVEPCCKKCNILLK